MQAKVLIAIPNLGSIHPLLVMRLMGWFTGGAKGVAELQLFMPMGQIPHDSARNFCVQHFLKTDFTHLFFIDSDVIPPADALEKLIGADKDLVSGLYASMKQGRDGEPTKRWNIFVYGKDELGEYGLQDVAEGEGLVPIKRSGGGCLLIKRNVLEAIAETKEPWFRFQYHAGGTMYYGEDIDFCSKAERAGFQLFAHFDVQCKHQKGILL